MTMTLEIISADRTLLHTGEIDDDGLPPEEAVYEALLDFAEEKSIPLTELDGIVAVGWPTTDPTERTEIYGSEWRP